MNVDLDFILNNSLGEPLGNCAEYCAQQITWYINDMHQRGYNQISDWAQDYKQKLLESRSAEMAEEQYYCIKNYYTSGISGLFQEVLDQILLRFKD